jgi:hypothetical protein
LPPFYPLVQAMAARQVRTLAAIVIVLAVGTVAFALAIGGDILTIVLGLLLAAMSMELFRLAKPEREDD